MARDRMVNVMLNAAEYQKLIDLTTATGRTKSAVLRRLLHCTEMVNDLRLIEPTSAAMGED
jgi:hypothetical protein